MTRTIGVSDLPEALVEAIRFLSERTGSWPTRCRARECAARVSGDVARGAAERRVRRETATMPQTWLELASDARRAANVLVTQDHFRSAVAF